MEDIRLHGFMPKRTMFKKQKEALSKIKPVKINDKPYTVQRLTNSEEYLKFNTLIRKYIIRKYNLRVYELDMILFLASEYLFKKSEFDRYLTMLGHKGKRHYAIDEMKKKNFVVIWKAKQQGVIRTTYFTLTKQAKIIYKEMHDIHSQKKLMQEVFPNMYKKQKWSSKLINNHFTNKEDPIEKYNRSKTK